MRFWVWRDLDRIFEEAWPFRAACKTKRVSEKGPGVAPDGLVFYSAP